MTDKLENRACMIIVEKVVENESKDKTKVSFIASDGIYSIEIPRSKEEAGYVIGQRYIGLFEPYTAPDFYGDRAETMVEGTCYNVLKRIETVFGQVVYEKNKEIKKEK